jgi:iron complex outermembrane receptor protein
MLQPILIKLLFHISRSFLLPYPWAGLIYLLPALLCLSPLSPSWAQEDADTIVITREDIEKMGFLNITDLLNQTPGVQAGSSSVALRGSYKVKVLVDGRSINDPTSSHGGVKWGMVSLENVEKIEILKGKGSVRFGDDSSGGVILITTAKMDELNGNVEAYWGNYHTQNYNFNCQGARGPFGAGISSTYSSTEGYRENDDDEKKRISAKFELMPTDESRMALSADYLHEEGGQPGLPSYPTPNARQTDETFSSALIAEYRKILSKSYLSRADRDNEDNDKNLYTSIQVQKMGEDVSAQVPIGRWGSVACGAGFEVAQAEGNKFDDQEELAYWMFLAKELPFQSIPLTFSLGLRANFYSDFDQAFNPELKTTFKQSLYMLQFTINRTNNAPSFLQRYNESSSTKPNPDLDMEQGTNMSFSVVPKLPEPFTGSVSVFYNMITDAITYVRGDRGVGRYENFGEVTYKGGEASLSWKPLDVVRIRTSYTYLEAVNEEIDKWLTAKPKHRVSADILYTPTPSLSLSFSVKYFSRQYTRSDNTESAPEYCIGDLRAEYGWKWGVSFFSEIKNLWDKEYLYGDGYPAPPLTWVTGMSYRF